ncbi:hypothetical protein FRB99_008233 [Tulasnella sp. 403]|nr:hypothetical protein FRB99_008233 [Tulasnella sp. 403]
MKFDLDDIAEKLPQALPRDTADGLERLNRIASKIEPGELVTFLSELLLAENNLFGYAITGVHPCALRLHKMIIQASNKRQMPTAARQALLKRLSTIVHSLPSKIAPRPDFCGEDVVAALISLTDNMSELRKVANLQDQKKMARALRSVSVSKATDPYAVLALKPPRNAKEAAELVDKLEAKTLEMTESFLEVLASQAVADHVQGLSSKADGRKRRQDDWTTFRDTSTSANAHELVAPDSTLLYLHDAGGGSSQWRIKMPQRVLGQLRQLNKATIYDRVQDKIRKLAAGDFSHNGHIPVTDNHLGPQIYKSWIDGDYRLIYMVDCDVVTDSDMEDPYEIQCIRILGVYHHNRVNKRFWSSVAAELGRQGEEYCERCRARPYSFRGSGTLLPMVFKRAGEPETQGANSRNEPRYEFFSGAGMSPDSSTQYEESDPSPNGQSGSSEHGFFFSSSFRLRPNPLEPVRTPQPPNGQSEMGRVPDENEDKSDEEFKQLHCILSLDKFVPVSQKMFDAVQDHEESSFVFEVKPQERRIIEHPSSSIVLGRSGTGKTTTMLFKMLALEIQPQISGQKIRQLFVTQSRTLAKKVKTYFHSLVNTIQYQETGVNRASRVPNTRSLSIRDMDNESTPMPEEDRPNRFSELKDDDFPLFLAFDELCVLLAGDCSLETTTRPSTSTKSLNIPQTTAPFQPFISFDDGFLSTIWPRLNEKQKKGLDPALVFSEIVGVIKGSGRTLDRKSYEEMSRRRHATFANDRSRIYDLFEMYEKKRPLPSYDAADRTRWLLRNLKLSKPTLLDYVYVDEIQDNLIIDAALTVALLSQVLRGLSRNPHGLFFAGDTAQTISVGSDFRFVELKDFLYAHERRAGRKAAPVDPKYFELYINYRSHRGIINAAAELVSLMSRFFPSSIDSLIREMAIVEGPKPMFITNRLDDSGLRDMISANSKGKCGLGAQQAILVRNRAAAERLKQTVERPGIVLTIYDSKGMEFDDILLYDFFADSLAPPRSWRALCQAASGGNFDEKSHAVLQSELKCLYVGLTRARYRVWLWDRTDVGVDMEGLMVSQELAVTLPPLATLPSIAALSSPQEWEKQGRELFSKRLYEDAAYCFEQADLQWLYAVSLTFDVRKTARKFPIGSAERRKTFGEAGCRFRSVGTAEACTLPDDHQLLFTNSGECFVEAGDHASAGEAFLEAGDYTKATWHFRMAERFDDAARIISHYGDKIDPAILQKVKYVVQVVYTKKGQLRKARDLFNSADDYTEFMDDQGFVNQKIAFLESVADHDKLAEASWQQGDHTKAIWHLLVSSTPSAKPKAIIYLMDALRVSFPFSTRSNTFATRSGKELLSFADHLALSREQQDEVELFRALSDPVGTYPTEIFANLAERFHLRGDHRCALLAYHAWVRISGLPHGTEFSTENIALTLNRYRNYFRTIREIARIPSVASQKIYHGMFGIQDSQPSTPLEVDGPAPTEYGLSPRSFIFQEAVSHHTDSGATTGSPDGIRIPSQELSGLISKALYSQLNPCVRRLHSHFSGDHFLLALQNSNVSAVEYNQSFGILLLLIATLEHQVVLCDDDNTKRQSMQEEWLTRVFRKLYPQRLQDHGIANITPSLIPQFEETLPIFKTWLQEHFARQRPGNGRQFLTNVVMSAMVIPDFDYRGARYYLRRGQWSKDSDIARAHRLFALVRDKRGLNSKFWENVWQALIQVSEDSRQATGGLVSISDPTEVGRHCPNPSAQSIELKELVDLVTQSITGSSHPGRANIIQQTLGLPVEQAPAVTDNPQTDPISLNETEDHGAEGIDHIAWTPKEEKCARLIQACFRRYRKRSGVKIGGPLYEPFCEVVQALEDRSREHPRNPRLLLYCMLLRGPLIHCVNELQRLKGLCEGAICDLNKRMATAEDRALDEVYEKGTEIRSLKEAIEELMNTLGPKSPLHSDRPSLPKLNAQVERIPDVRRQLTQFVDIQEETDDSNLGDTTILRVLLRKTAHKQAKATAKSPQR